MIKGYNENYLNDVMDNLGNMFDYAVNVYNLNIDDFGNDYIASDVSQGIEIGNVFYLNKSSIELFHLIYKHLPYIAMETPNNYNKKTKEYWLGCSIGYYQWYSQYKFSTIFNAVKLSELLMMYDTLHEADIMKFCELIDIKIKNSPTQLQRLRKNVGISQSTLAKLSGIKVRTIQSYEQRESDINKAQVNQIRSLSLVLGCNMEDLLE